MAYQKSSMRAKMRTEHELNLKRYPKVAKPAALADEWPFELLDRESHRSEIQ
jgi:hypothetical protein